MALFVDGLVYYEFVPLNQLSDERPDIIPLSDVSLDTPYVMVVSNISGLYRYIMEDVVVFGQLHPFKLRIAGRTSGFLNTFGEEVMEETCNAIIRSIVAELGVQVNDFTVAPRFEDLSNPQSMGCHEWLIEFNQDILVSESQLAKTIDRRLLDASHDYSEKRKEDLIMCAPKVRILPKGSFLKYLGRNRKIGVQSKIPRISRNRDLLEELCTIT